MVLGFILSVNEPYGFAFILGAETLLFSGYGNKLRRG